MHKLTLDSPSKYRISIQGLLGADWGDRLSGLQIVTLHSMSGRTVTILCGEVADQTALLGVLNTLYDLRYPLLSVECLDGDDNCSFCTSYA